MAVEAKTFVRINVAASGDTVLLSGTPNTTTRLVSLILVSSGTVSVTFKSAAVSLTAAMPLVVNGQLVLDYNPTGWMQTATQGDDFIINLSAAIQVSGCATFSVA